jgi:hypothetical protein
MRKHGDVQVLVVLSKAFISGEGRNRNFVRSLEGLFDNAARLHEDSKFEELEEAFAMYGASSQDYDDQVLTKALKKVLPILEGQL